MNNKENKQASFPHTTVCSGAVWNRNIEEYRATSDYQLENKEGQCFQRKKGDKPVTRKSSFMICDILSENDTSSEDCFPTESSYNKDTEDVSNSSVSIRSNTPDTGKNNQLNTTAELYFKSFLIKRRYYNCFLYISRILFTCILFFFYFKV